MSTLIKKDGFDYAFDPSKCSSCGGACCTGESGAVRLTQSKMVEIADYLQVELDEFIKIYTKKDSYRYLLKEVLDGNSYECIFFDREFLGCSIYAVRPSQCVTFPFWDYYATRVEELKLECVGIVDV